MGFGISQYIPVVIYIMGLIAALLSIFYKPILGILFLFPLLPYQTIFDEIALLPFGKDLNDVLIISIMIGTFLQKRKTHKKEEKTDNKNSNNFYTAIILLVISSFIGLYNSIFNEQLPFNLINSYFIDWKNYILLPIIGILTYMNIKDRKTLQLMVTLLVIGIFGAGFYFYREIRWMDFSNLEVARNKMTGLFVYLGPNHYGAFFAHYIFILFGLLFFTKSNIKKIIISGIILLLIYSIFFTFSRGAYFAFLAGILFLILTKQRWLILLFIAFILVWETVIPRLVVERIKMTQDEWSGELEPSAARRIELWETAISMSKNSFIIGNGFNSFRYKGFTDTHNIYLKMLSELGIIGLLSFLYLCSIAFISGWKLFRLARDDLFKGLGIGFATCVISLMVTNLFGDRWSYLSLSSYFWVFFGLVIRALKINNAEFVCVKKYDGKRNKSITSHK